MKGANVDMMKRISLLLIFFLMIFMGCNHNTGNENIDDSPDVELENYTFSTESELNAYIQTNVQSLKFKNDPYGNLLYVELGDILVKFDAYNAQIIEDGILIPYSYTFNEKWGSSYAIYKILDDDKGGVLLSFDDYYNPNWNDILPIFNEFGIKATFFCFGDPKTRTGLKQFIFLAKAYGMQVGYHTLNHKVMTNMTKEEVFKNAIEPLQTFTDLGVQMSAMSLPGGGVPIDTDAFDLLKENFKIVRASGLERVNLYYTPEEISKGFIYGASFDQLFFSSDESFRNMIKMRLIVAKMTNKIWPGFGHYFLEEGETVSDMRYTVKIENLKYMFNIINTLKLKSHLYEEYY